MIKNENFSHYTTNSANLNVKTIFLIGFLIIIPLAYSSLLMVNNTQEQPEIRQNLLSDGLGQTVDLPVKNSANKLLSGFQGGFKVQEDGGDPSISYFIQNSQMSVGFGTSMIKILLKTSSESGKHTLTEISQTFLNSNLVKPTVQGSLDSKAIYFIGSSTGVKKQEYSQIIFKNLYTNIDLEYILKDGNLKYNFYVYPGGNPNDIELSWTGPLSLEKGLNQMKLTVSTPTGQKSIVDSNLFAYQEDISSKPMIDFALKSTHSYGFTIKNYNSNELLVIDPMFLMYSTYVGGLNSEQGTSLTVDTSGNVYVTGYTLSSNFPTVNAYNNSYGGNYEIFVYKLSADGSTMIYSTFIGGSNVDQATGIAMDSSNNVYLTGNTYSSNFPTVNAYNSTFGGGSDLFVLKLSVDGSSLLYSTFIGGSNYELANSITLDSVGNAYVTGYTQSNNFPTVNAYNSTFGGGSDVFVLKLSADGSTMLYSTFVGGSLNDIGNSIALDIAGNAYVTGNTYSSNFPTVNAYNNTFIGGNTDIFVFKLSADGLNMIYSTFVGGSSYDYGNSIALDSAGNAYVTGYTQSADFPTVNAYNTIYDGVTAVIVFKLSTDGSTLMFSTFVTGSGNDYANSIVLDNNFNAFVTGYTQSSNFPIVKGYNNTFGGGNDIFVFELSADGSSLMYSTFIGGQNNDQASSITLDNSGSAYITGYTTSPNFPTVNGYNKVYNSTFGGGAYSDSFIFKLVNETDPVLMPSQVSAIKSDTSQSLVLVWNEPSFLKVTHQHFIKYNIYRGTSPGIYDLLRSTTVSHFVDNTVVTGQTYYYTVQSVYTIGESLNSTEITVTIPTTPSAPTVQATPGNGSVYVSWTVPSSDGGSSILEYQIFRGTQTGQYSFIGVTSNLYFNDTMLNGGITYYYVVIAINSVGKGSYSAEITATPFGSSSYGEVVTSTLTLPGSIITTTEIASSSSTPANSPSFEAVTVIALFSCLAIYSIYRRSKK